MRAGERTCPSCHAALSGDQRYCVLCGETVESPLARVRDALATAPPTPAPPARRWSALLGPGPGILATALGVGVLTGVLVDPGAPSAASRSFSVVLPPMAAPPLTEAPRVFASPVPPVAPPPVPAAELPEPADPAPPSAEAPVEDGEEPVGQTPADEAPGLTPPPVQNVWLIVLSDQRYDELYGDASPARFLVDELVPQGTLLPNYYGTAHGALAGSLALITGQGANPELQADCPLYRDLDPGTVDPADGQARGQGCVMPKAVPSLPEQLVANFLTWRAYIAGQGAPGDPATTCRRPASGEADPTVAGPAPDGYVTRRNPFMYLRSVIDSETCAQDDVGLEQLGTDLDSGEIPTLSYIAPSLCDAGAEGACPEGSPATGPAAADAFLRAWVPRIQATQAYQDGGMIVVLADQAPAAGARADSSACCDELEHPNTDNPGGPATPGPGGGRTGALVLSPFASAGAVVDEPADHYSLLRTIEDIFNMPSLGFAAARQPFGEAVFPPAA